jgi:lysozyme
MGSYLRASSRRRALSSSPRFEGFVPTPYNDAAGHATIGYGHLIHLGPVTDADRKRWGRITRDQGIALLRKDAQVAADAVYRLVRPRIMSQSRFDALVSFVFNVGVGAFEQSTLLRKRLNSGRARTGRHDEFLKWDKAGGRVSSASSAAACRGSAVPQWRLLRRRIV